MGWYKDKNCTQEWSFDYPVNSNITLYAKWEGPSRLEILESATNGRSTCINYVANDELFGQKVSGEDWTIGFVSGYKGKIVSYKWEADLYLEYFMSGEYVQKLERENVLDNQTSSSVSGDVLANTNGYEKDYVVHGRCIVTVKLGNNTEKFVYNNFIVDCVYY